MKSVSTAKAGVPWLRRIPLLNLLTAATYKWEAEITGTGTEKITVWELSYPKYMSEINLSWYF